MNIKQVGAQLFTVRDFVKTEDAVARSFEKLAKIGYQAVEVAAVGPIPPEKLKQLAADNGLTICATHAPATVLRQTPQQAVEQLQALGCALTIYPYPANVDLGSEACVASLIEDLEKATEVLKKAGQVLAYHNHHVEFRKLKGEIILERIFRQSSIQGEIDTYWVQYGGGDPTQWCRQLKGRLPIIHLKDFGINDKSEIAMCEIGKGNLDFKGIISAAESSGCKWFVVEQDTCPGDPFDSLEISFNYIKEHLVV